MPRVQRIGGEHGPLFHEVWNTRETPARIDRASGEPAEDGIQLVPPANGTRIRVLDVPPEGDWLDGMTADEIQAHFAEVGAGDATSVGSRHALMHRTETVDYVFGPTPKLGMLFFVTTHTYEHYGNLVTYMRLNKIVPPSSEPPPAAPGR